MVAVSFGLGARGVPADQTGAQVRPGAVLQSLSGQIGWVLVANVVPAPFVAEFICRGSGLRAPIRRHGRVAR